MRPRATPARTSSAPEAPPYGPWCSTVAAIADGLDVAPLITGEVDLAAAPVRFDALESADDTKVLIRPG